MRGGGRFFCAVVNINEFKGKRNVMALHAREGVCRRRAKWGLVTTRRRAENIRVQRK